VYSEFTSLEIDRPEDWILRITLRTPGKLNAVGHEAHAHLAAIWQAVDRDPDTRVVVVRGADGAFSSGGDLDLVEDIARDWETRLRVFQSFAMSSTRSTSPPELNAPSAPRTTTTRVSGSRSMVCHTAASWACASCPTAFSFPGVLSVIRRIHFSGRSNSRLVNSSYTWRSLTSLSSATAGSASCS